MITPVMRNTRGADTGTRLGLALLAYMLAVTIIITLLPFQFEWPRQWKVLLGGPAADVVANVLLFVPLGFLYRLAFGRGPALQVLLIGALASASIEAAQLFESTRQASAADVAANAAGAWLGAIAFDRAARTGKADGRLIGWLALELPLMGLTYLLVPLLWVSSLASGGDTVRSAITILPGVFGAVLLGGMQRHYFGHARAAEPRETAAFAAIWFLAGAFPLLAWHSLYVVAGAAAVGVLCWLLGRRRVRETASNRRFEVPLLGAAAPVYAAYLVLLVALPLRSGMGEWRGAVGFPAIASDQIEILRLLELVAAFTLVGYMVAEFRGRAVALYRDAVPRLLGWGAGLALATEAVRGYHDGYGASAARGILVAGAALYGGWLYYLQRAHVMRLLSWKPPERAESGTMR